MAWAVLPVMDGMAKHLSMELPVLEVVWARYFFMVVLTLPISFLFFRKHLTWPKSIKIQLARSTFLFSFNHFIFLCNFHYIFAGDLLALAFVHPIIGTLIVSNNRFF